MATKDSAAAIDRVAPGIAAPYDAIKFTFTNVASAYQAIRTKVGNQQLPDVWISFKVTADCHVAFGPSNMIDPTNANAFLFQAADGIQDVMLTADMAGFKVKGDSAGGDIYIWRSGK